MKHFLSIIFCSLICVPVLARAAVSSDFIFRVSVGDDVTPPSTPTLLSVAPIASSQIDVDWSVSTDNWLFGGYVLLRDGVPIATTTLTSYSDTGLTPETLYAYAVYAFDAAGNISTTSNSLSTSTLAVPTSPPAPVTPTSTSQVTQTLRLGAFDITPGRIDASFSWSTNVPTRYLIRWGRTDSYTGGYIRNESYSKEHITSITDLEPGTRYEYEVIGYSPANIAISLKQGSFTTLGDEEVRLVSNVERLTATVLGDDVRLDFVIPKSEPGATVWVVRSYLGYPTDLYDGAVVYEGVTESVFDKDALKDTSPQYYTVFVIAADGRVSSGATAMAASYPSSQTGQSDDTSSGDPGLASTSSNGDSHSQSDDKEDILLDLLDVNDIVLTQGERSFTFLSEEVALSYTLPFTVSIHKEALPRHLKSIIVTLIDPTDQRRNYSFLLRLNQDGSAYEATISPLNVLGMSKLVVEVYDFDLMVIGRYGKQIVFKEIDTTETVVIFPDLFLQTLGTLWPGIVSVFGLFILVACSIWWLRRRTEDKE